MKRLFKNKLYLAIGIAIILFVVMGTVSLSSLALLQGNARVVNYVGIVRGATQKLVKEELMGYPDDALLERLDGIVNELLTGTGSNNLVVLPDGAYLEHMRAVQESWSLLKENIVEVRSGSGAQELYDASQAYFDLVNETVFAAEAYSEAQVGHINGIMIGVNVAFVALIVVGAVFAVRSAAIKRRVDVLGKIAYVDPLTAIDNRASCERCIDQMVKTPPEQDIAAFMFDMNDLKLTNDFLGHQGGDKVILAFATILSVAARPYGFLGRYGGDEFLALFVGGNEALAIKFLDTVRTEVDVYNEVRTNKLEKISYAAGFAHGNLKTTSLDDIIHAADNQMYRDKRKLKQASSNSR